MYIFYDFETSSRELLGQIMSYAFIVTDLNYNPVDECCGTIKLNPTQIPEPDAILTNKINVLEHQKTATPEPKAADVIYKFLNSWCLKSPFCALVGFNSNSFDLQFLRNLLIRHGINPYFKGQLKNRDILHFAKYIAIQNSDTFKWREGFSDQTQTSYWQFKLESLATDYGILTDTQSHDAREDVELTIKLVQKLESLYPQRLIDFNGFSIQDMDNIGIEPTIGWREDGQLPNKIIYRPWALITKSPKVALAVNLDTYDPTKPEDLTPLRYINANKQFFHLQPAAPEHLTPYQDKLTHLKQNTFIQSLTLSKYFELTPKDWDIEYQIHQLGFEHIDSLRHYIRKLDKTPTTYHDILDVLMAKRQTDKDTYLIQLFNRYYLNHHNTSDDLANRYMAPRYITGKLNRNPDEFTPLHAQLNRINDLLSTHPNDSDILEALKIYTLEKEVKIKH